MVNPELIDHARKALGDVKRRILVTGATGFVGSHLARCLAEAGHEVTATGRNRYRTHRILHPNINFLRGDICKVDEVDRWCEKQDLVFHCAAMTTPWGNRKRITETNVRGTENIINGCLRQNVERLVHVSSTSVFFCGTDLIDHQDDSPYPEKSACPYSSSKRQAELLVKQAGDSGLNVFIVRARAVFGEGDTTLLPRLVEAARNGRLRQIGDGMNWVDLTFIDNLILALVSAAKKGDSGGLCTITNHEPVKLWDLLPQIFTQLDIPYSGKKISYRAAYAAAGLSECIHWLFPRLGEPRITRYTAGLLSKSQVFSQSAASTMLDYHPIVSIDDGIAQTIRYWQSNDARHSSVNVKLTCLTTGYTVGNRRLVERTAKAELASFHAMVGLVDHPLYGLTLFDTGYAAHLTDLSDTAARFYNRMLPTITSNKLTVSAQLAQRGVDPKSVKRVLISHFHPDHIAGLKDFPEADFIASAEAWHAVRNRKGIRAAVRYAFLPGLLPKNFEDRLCLIETFDDPGIGPFKGCHDLFGDKSVRLFDLSGHAAGQIGALLQTGIDQRDFLVADAAWTSSAIRDCALPHWATRIFLHSFSEMIQTIEKVCRLQAEFPDIRVLPTHCPEVALRFGFDEQIQTQCQ